MAAPRRLRLHRRHPPHLRRQIQENRPPRTIRQLELGSIIPFVDFLLSVVRARHAAPHLGKIAPIHPGARLPPRPSAAPRTDTCPSPCVASFNPSAAISARRVLRLLFPPHLSRLGKPPRREATARAVRACLPRGPSCPCKGKSSANQRSRKLSWRCVARQTDSLGGCIQRCGKGLQRRQVTSESAFTSETFVRSGRPLPRESEISPGRAGVSPS